MGPLLVGSGHLLRAALRSAKGRSCHPTRGGGEQSFAAVAQIWNNCSCETLGYSDEIESLDVGHADISHCSMNFLTNAIFEIASLALKILQVCCSND